MDLNIKHVGYSLAFILLCIPAFSQNYNTIEVIGNVFEVPAMDAGLTPYKIEIYESVDCWANISFQNRLTTSAEVLRPVLFTFDGLNVTVVVEHKSGRGVETIDVFPPSGYYVINNSADVAENTSVTLEICEYNLS